MMFVTIYKSIYYDVYFHKTIIKQLVKKHLFRHKYKTIIKQFQATSSSFYLLVESFLRHIS